MGTPDAKVTARINQLSSSDWPAATTFNVVVNANGNPLGLALPNGSLPYPQGGNPAIYTAAVKGTEPVTANGEFVVEETDLNFAGFGVPFTFARYYRSGVNYHTPLGFGWNHNFGRRLVEAPISYENSYSCNKRHDILYVSERMDRVRFAYESTSPDGSMDYYANREPGTGLQLSMDRGRPNMPWAIQDGKGNVYRFDSDWGNLVSITDPAGHTIRVNWNHDSWQQVGGKVTSVVDTTGRTIYFVYRTIIQLGPGSDSSSWEALQCLSLSDNCSHPLVSFEVRPIKAMTPKLENLTTSTNRIEFDLVRVLDGNGNGPTYTYYRPNDTEYWAEFDRFLPSAYLPYACQAFCGDKSYDCRYFDACAVALEDALRECKSVSYAHCYDLCMSRQTWGGNSDAYGKADWFCRSGGCATYADEATSNCRSDVWASILGSNGYDLDYCRSDCLVNCLRAKAPPNGKYAYGLPPELYHNLIRIVDGDGRIVVENTYGENPLSPDFDKVIRHVQGKVLELSSVGGNASSAKMTNEITFEYHDLAVEAKGLGVPQPYSSYVMPLAKFAAVAVCPSTCIRSHVEYGLDSAGRISVCDQVGTGYDPAKDFSGPDPWIQQPAYAVVTHDIGGVIRTTYHDSLWRLLREVSHNLALTNDYNYQDGWLRGIRYPAGDRVCIESDSFGNPTRVTRIPASGYPGDQAAQVMEMTYDDKEQVIQVLRNPDTFSRAGQRFIRDQFERIVAIGDQVDSRHTEWTCFSYQDPVEKLTAVRAGPRPTALLSIGTTNMSASASNSEPAPTIEPTLMLRSPGNVLTNRRVNKSETPNVSAAIGLIGPPVRLGDEALSVGGPFFSTAAAANVATEADGGGTLTSAERFLRTNRGPVDVSERSDISASEIGHLTFPDATSHSGLVEHRPSTPMFVPSGCAVDVFGQKKLVLDPYAKYRRRDVTPSLIIRPDGSMTQLTNLSSGGPGVIALDAGGPDPTRAYRLYDDFGRVKEVGRLVGGVDKVLPGASSRAIYNDAGLLVRGGTQDPNTGDWVDTIFGYDKSHHLTSVNGPTFRRDIVVNALGHIEKISDSPGSTDSHHTPPRKMSYKHDIHGRLLRTDFPEGNIEKNVFDAAGRLQETWRGYGADLVLSTPGQTPMEKVAATEYGTKGFISGELRDGVNLKFVTDGFGRVIDTQVPDHQVWLSSPIGIPGSKTTTITVYRHFVRGFDSLGRVEWEGVFDEPPSGYSKPVALIPGMHSMAEYRYDLLGRPTQIDHWCFTEDPLAPNPAGLLATTKIAWNDALGTVSITDPEGKISSVTRDGVGRVKHITIAAGTSDQRNVDYAYSGGGDSVIVTISPVPTTTGKLVRKYDYSPHGSLISVSEDNQSLLSVAYDFLGRPTSSIFLGQGERSVEYDAYDRPVAERQVTDKNVVSTNTTYWNGNDYVTRIVDGASHTTTNYYDGLDRLFKQANGIGETTFTYVPGTARLATRRDSSATDFHFTYDYAGRLFKIEIADGIGTRGDKTKLEYSYTPLDQIREATRVDSLGPTKVSFQYDSIGRKLFEANDALPLSIAHSYFPGVRITSIVKAGQNVGSITETYDSLYRPKALLFNDALIAGFDYQSGELASISYGNQVREVLAYDNRARPARVDFSGNSAPIATLTDVLGVDSVPRERERKFGLQRTITDLFKVDLDGRITAENLQVPNVPRVAGDASNSDVDGYWNTAFPWSVYRLDGAANWVSRQGSGQFAPTIDGANRYSKIDSTPVAYDPVGNLTSYSNEAYLWNALGELTGASIGSMRQTFTYDALGRRISESDGATTDFFVWDGSQIIARGSGNDADSARLRIGAGAESTLALVDKLGMGPSYFVHAGTDGSTLAVTDIQGQLVEGYAYSAYGETTIFDPSAGAIPKSKIDNRFLFQGQLYDPALSLYSMRAREYKPKWGRFLSPDPIGIGGGLNIYAFVEAHPLTHTDPSGLGTWYKNRLELYQDMVELDKRFQPKLFPGILGIANFVSPENRTDFVLHPPRGTIVGIVQGFGLPGDPDAFVVKLGTDVGDAYVQYNKYGEYEKDIAVFGTAISTFSPPELLAGFAAPAVRAGSGFIKSLVLDAEGAGAALGSESVAVASTVGRTRVSGGFVPTGNRVLDTLGFKRGKYSTIKVQITPGQVGADLANTRAHEAFHVAVARRHTDFFFSKRLPYFGAFPRYGEEVGAYFHGALKAGQFGSALWSPIDAFGSLSLSQALSVTGTSAAVGGLLYYDLSK